jgi:hypothetical protein
VVDDKKSVANWCWFSQEDYGMYIPLWLTDGNTLQNLLKEMNEEIVKIQTSNLKDYQKLLNQFETQYVTTTQMLRESQKV